MRTFEDFTEGLTIDVGPYEVSREEIVGFAAAYDPQPFHLDEEAAKATLLGGLAASGWHSCGIMMRMMADAFIRDSTSQGSPGVDFVRWVKPVRPGDRLTGTATVLSSRMTSKRPTLGIAKVGVVLRNAASETVLQSEYALLLLTREGAGL